MQSMVKRAGMIIGVDSGDSVTTIMQNNALNSWKGYDVAMNRIGMTRQIGGAIDKADHVKVLVQLDRGDRVRGT